MSPTAVAPKCFAGDLGLPRGEGNYLDPQLCQQQIEVTSSIIPRRACMTIPISTKLAAESIRSGLEARVRAIRSVSGSWSKIATRAEVSMIIAERHSRRSP